MVNYLLNLPDDIFDIILSKCAENYIVKNNSSTNLDPLFIRYEYIFTNPIQRKYYEYTGTMRNGNPNGTGIMYKASTFLDETMIQNTDQHSLTTGWLYLPFLYTIYNCNRSYKLRYMLLDDSSN